MGAPLRGGTGAGGYTMTPIAGGNPNDTSGIYGANGTDPFGGFAARYVPGQTDPYADPSFVLLDLLRSMGATGNIQQTTGFQELADLNGADPLSLFIAMAGGGPVGGRAQSDEAYLNWLADFYAQQGSVGGRDIDVSEIIRTLTGGQADNSLLGNLLSSGGAREQVRTLSGLLGDAARVGLNPVAAAAMQTLVQRLGTEFVSERARTPAAQQSDETFAQFFGRNYGGR